MIRVKSGDLGPYGLLYERHKKRLFGFFYNMNNNPSVSEDLVQNVFIRMLKYKHTFTGEGSFTAWMFKTGRNVFYDHYRNVKKGIHFLEIGSGEYHLKEEDNEQELTDSEDRLKSLQKAMMRLAPEKREILVLSKFKELKFQEIAEILGCSEGAAKVKAHRALKELRTLFFQFETRKYYD
jgi:RNA polymerase sigma factor (sigma-70 family)